MTAPQQNFANHARNVPLYHFVLSGLLALNFVHALRRLLPFTAGSFYEVSLATALILMAWFVRAFPIAVQDRVIRLEERLRWERLVPDLAPRLDELKPEQWTALRFASDGELPALARDVLAGKLVRSADIKKAIQHWRADTLRA